MLGYNGGERQVFLMSFKIDELYEEFNLDTLLDVFEDYLIGKLSFTFQFTFVDIAKGLKEKGVRTKKERAAIEEAAKFTDDFYNFQKEIGNG